MDIPTLMRKARKDYATQDNMLVHHDEINNGLCRMFARYFASRAGEHGLEVTIYKAGFESDAVPAHAWIEHNGMCYDADCPDGVPTPTQLPYYRKRGPDSVPEKKRVR